MTTRKRIIFFECDPIFRLINHRMLADDHTIRQFFDKEQLVEFASEYFIDLLVIDFASCEFNIHQVELLLKQIRQTSRNLTFKVMIVSCFYNYREINSLTKLNFESILLKPDYLKVLKQETLKVEAERSFVTVL